MFKKSFFCFPLFILVFSFSISVFALNPNTASVDELANELVGVGPKLAERIIQYREENGNFETIDDLMSVQGIGISVVDKNRDRIEFEEE